MVRIGPIRKVWLALCGPKVPGSGIVPAIAGGEAQVEKPREKRVKVVLRARMYIGASWSEVCIVDITSRGLGLQAARPPGRGEYVEIRRGAHTIIGRVIWSGAHRFGVAAQGTMPVYSIINEPDKQVLDPAKVERRAVPRPPKPQVESRIRVRLFEFLCVAGIGVGIAVTVAGTVQAAIATPMALISNTLGSKQAR